jgi:hypothetical protein
MTTFTTEDREKATQVEPIPFVGWVHMQDKEDTEQMLRDQIRIQNEHIQQLKRKIRELENND